MRSSPLSTIEKALKYWDYSKNTDNPSIVSITSSEKRYFICENGHSSLCQIRIFVQREKFYCRECQKTPLDIKLLQKNSITIKDNLTSVVHNKKYEWNCLKCSQKFNDRYRKLLQRLNNNKIMCPYCAEEKGYLKKGINDFQTQYPMLASLVVSHQPDSFMSSSSEKIQWTCNTNKNHIYFMSPKERIKKDLCKLCSYQESANQKRMRTAEDNKIPKAILNTVIDSEIPLTKLSAGSSKNWIEIEYPDCGHHRKTNPRNIVNFPQCSICSRGKPHSKSEKEILSFIQENIDPTIKIFANDRSVIAPQELDIYIPELKLAFEFNGLYWHSEKYKHKNYHADKWNNCRKNNVKLVSIWEDEWIYHQSTIKNIIIKNIQQNDYRIKNTAIKEIPYEDFCYFVHDYSFKKVDKFYNNLYGVFDNETLIAVFAFKISNNNIVELSYCSSQKITQDYILSILRKILDKDTKLHKYKIFHMIAENDKDYDIFEENPHIKMGDNIEPQLLSTTINESSLKIWDYGKTLWKIALE